VDHARPYTKAYFADEPYLFEEEEIKEGTTGLRSPPPAAIADDDEPYLFEEEEIKEGTTGLRSPPPAAIADDYESYLFEEEEIKEGTGGNGAPMRPPKSSDYDNDGNDNATVVVDVAEEEAYRMVGRCRLPVSKPVLKAHRVLALEAII